jgi:hypothetical protein
MNVAQTTGIDFSGEAERRQRTLEGYIATLDRNAAYWGNRHRTGLLVIQLLTGAATLIMTVNLILKDNIPNVGGWIPFCITAAILTALATFYTTSQQSEVPNENRSKCLEAKAQLNGLSRKLGSVSTWTERKLQDFDRRLSKIESDSSMFLTPPPSVRPEYWWYAIGVVVVLLYLGYEFPRAMGVEWQQLLQIKPKS